MFEILCTYISGLQTRRSVLQTSRNTLARNSSFALSGGWEELQRAKFVADLLRVGMENDANPGACDRLQLLSPFPRPPNSINGMAEVAKCMSLARKTSEPAKGFLFDGLGKGCFIDNGPWSRKTRA